MVLNDFEYGAILQKIKVRMPEAESDEAYGLVDGNSVDHYKVAKPEEISYGEAEIITVLEGNIKKKYKINISKIIEGETKNLVFNITDKELIEKTGGIIQGMSGSPIIQNNMIIGAVTHVVVDDPIKGYGIFITNMLEEAEN